MMRQVSFQFLGLFLGLFFISQQLYAESNSHITDSAREALRSTTTAGEATKPDITDYVTQARWVDEVFQYGDANGKWHNANTAYRATKDGEFLNASNSRVSYSKGDILFKTDSLGWFKARPDTKNLGDVITDKTVPNPKNVEISELEKWIIHYTNVYRLSLGLKALVVSQGAMNTSRKKSFNMAQTNNMSHSVPPMPAFENTMGENIAQGQSSAKEVVNTWIHSEGHRRNMINPSFLNIGVGESSRYWTQQFTG